MATEKLIDNVTVTRNKIYKGAGRLVVSDPDVLTSFPGVLESVINPASPKSGAAYALADGWTDLGPTTEDGITLQRTISASDGIALDQRKSNLDEGEPEDTTMSLETELLHTDLDTLKIVWQGGNKRTIADAGTNVAQHSLDFDAPQTFTERMLAVIQEDPKSGKLRVFAFRKAIPDVDSELVIQSNEATGLPASFMLRTDTTVNEGSGQFGKVYEED